MKAGPTSTCLCACAQSTFVQSGRTRSGATHLLARRMLLIQGVLARRALAMAGAVASASCGRADRGCAVSGARSGGFSAAQNGDQSPGMADAHSASGRAPLLVFTCAVRSVGSRQLETAHSAFPKIDDQEHSSSKCAIASVGRTGSVQ